MSQALPIAPSDRGPQIFTAVDGQTVFTPTFPLQLYGDELVEKSIDGGLIWTPLTLGADYALAGLRDPDGFTVTLVVPCSEDNKLRISGDAPIEDTTDFSPANTVKRQGLNDKFDRITIWLQELRRKINETLIPITDLLTWRNEAQAFRDAALAAKADAELARDLALSAAGQSILTIMSRTTMAAMSLPSAIKGVQTLGLNASGDGARAPYKRVATMPAHDGRVRTLDRYLPNGTIDNANGGWWELDLSEGKTEVAWFLGSGVSFDTAFGQALACAQKTKTDCILPGGSFTSSGEFVIDTDGTRLIGAGPRNTIITVSGSGGVWLRLFNAALPNGLTNCALRDFRINGALTGPKIGIILQNTSDTLLENLGVYNWSEAGGNAIGLCLQGRELTRVRGYVGTGDYPIFIQRNPQRAAFILLDCDHLELRNTYLIPLRADRHCVTVQDGTNITNLKVAGDNAWALGAHGFYCVDTLGDGNCTTWMFENIRREQVQQAGAYCIFIDRAASPRPLFSLKVIDCHVGNGNSFRLFNVFYTTIKNHMHEDPSSYGIVANQTCREITFEGCEWLEGTLSQISGLSPARAARQLVGPMAKLPATGRFVSDNFAVGTAEWRGPSTGPGGRRRLEWARCYTMATGPGNSFVIPIFQAETVVWATIRITTSNGEGGTVRVSAAGAVLGGDKTTNFDLSGGAGKFSVIFAGMGSISLVNNLAGTVDVDVEVIAGVVPPT